MKNTNKLFLALIVLSLLASCLACISGVGSGNQTTAPEVSNPRLQSSKSAEGGPQDPFSTGLSFWMFDRASQT